MIRELERLLSNCYAPHDKIFYSDVAKMNYGYLFAGGFV